MSKTDTNFLGSQVAAEVLKILPASDTTSFNASMKSLPMSLFIKTVEQSPVAISITDKKANILYINQAFTDVTGYTETEILGENESKLSDRTTPKQIYYVLWHTISSKKIWQGQLVNRRKQGQRYLADLTIAPMLDEDGKITHYIGMHRDITSAHRDQQQIKNQKQLIESMINASSVAMVVLDKNLRVVLDNQMYKMLNTELKHNEPALFFLQALQDEIGDLWSTDQQLGQSFNNLEVRVEASGYGDTRWYSCSGNFFIENDTQVDSFFSQESKQYLLLSINDITRQRQQQEKLQLQILRNMLAEEEYLRSIRETLLGAMHQIGLPLNQIKAAIKLMAQRNDNDNAPLRDLLNQVQKMGEQTLETLGRCVPEIPEVAQIPVNLNRLLHEVMLLNNQKFLANGVVVDWLPDPMLPNVLGAENKLRMLFKQLIDNAVNAMNRGTNNERLITISTQVQQDWVCVSIADTGPGIPMHQRNKVFEPFFTTQPVSSSVQAGMGLVMAREIVNQHNGLIEIDATYSLGCRFNIRFPRHHSSVVTHHE